ncbi:MotE family protein [Bacillus infantis]|uniref:MotE family protein n=1 Tax=Bacillus infantis TaxID=324767 RepID=UPI00101B7EAE|nr:MotE family protein [Bacillus infantis]MCP1158057.1 MotE family protein [Bacillus infantis]RYI32132.1 hypothetical protein EVU96_00560 [Bacillus infantis]
MNKTAEETEKKYSKFQMFFILVVIPLLFAIAVTLIILTVNGTNVFEAGRELGSKIPVISEMIDKEQSAADKEADQRIVELGAAIEDREAQIERLESQLESKDSEIEENELEKQQLQNQIDELLAIQEENKRAFKDIVKTYETMSAKNAAPILAQMNDDEALQILSNVKPDTLAGIMEKMLPEDAAKFTELLTNESSRSASE